MANKIYNVGSENEEKYGSKHFQVLMAIIGEFFFLIQVQMDQ